MATHTLRPGQCVISNEEDEIRIGGTADIALADFSPSERKKGVALWRRAVEETCSGRTAPPRRVLAEVFAMAGGRGDPEQCFISDCRDWKAVKAGEAAEEADALGKFEAEHGTRKDLHDQLKICIENQRTLRQLLKKVDSLQKIHSLTVHQGRAIKASNGRLFD